ncbi:MAG: DNA repair protein RecO [Verrucomicrobiia bacterium]
MIESATGLILRTRLLTETSLIIHWLTPEFGRMATVARGARRTKSPFLGRLDLFFLADFTFSRSRRSDLHALREASLRDPHDALRRDLARLQLAAEAAALIEQATETETPLPAVFKLLAGFLDCLCHHPPEPQIVFAFKLKLLHELGLGPDLDQVELTSGAKQIVRTLAQVDWPAGLRLKLSKAQTEELRHFLHGFLIFHLGHRSKARTGALATG